MPPLERYREPGTHLHSAPRGLKPGSSGFCTVAMTQGMPPQLASKLEALSGYRQLFPPQDPQAGLNPVVHSYLRISFGRTQLPRPLPHSAAGLDYSQPPTSSHTTSCSTPANCRPPAPPGCWPRRASCERLGTEWLARCLPAAAPAGNLPAVCRSWQQAAGDAGWGGVLAETAADAQRAGDSLVPTWPRPLCTTWRSMERAMEMLKTCGPRPPGRRLVSKDRQRSL